MLAMKYTVFPTVSHNAVLPTSGEVKLWRSNVWSKIPFLGGSGVFYPGKILKFRVPQIDHLGAKLRIFLRLRRFHGNNGFPLVQTKIQIYGAV